MNPTYVLLELRRVTRDRGGLFFLLGLPACLYLVFGAAQGASTVPVGNGNGNVAMYVMVSMAAYGAVTVTTGVGGMAAVERLQGWGRQLGLTPMQDWAYVAMKTLVAAVVAAASVALVYVLGLLTGASAEPAVWLVSGLVVLAGAMVFALFGLAVALAFHTEAAVNAASGILVLLAFLGNVFVPLSGTLLEIGRFSPLYGYISLARYPLMDGHMIDGSGTLVDADPIWVPVLNVGAWALVFAAVAVLLVRRGRARQ